VRGDHIAEVTGLLEDLPLPRCAVAADEDLLDPFGDQDVVAAAA
jgi:hypothetical protein